MDERAFLAFAETAVSAALADPHAACRDRAGRWGSGYKPSPSDVVQLSASEIHLDTGAVLAIADDGAVRKDGNRIGQITVNGYLFAIANGREELVGVLDSHGKFAFANSPRVVAVASPGELAKLLL